MTTTITISKDYGYVLGIAATSYLVAFWHGMRVGPRRKSAKTPYPNAYASAESIATCADPEEKKAKYLFNCAQRAHQNYLENFPTMLSGLLLAGIQYPKTSAVAGAVWIVSRIAYAVGYTNPNETGGKGRGAGGLGMLHYFSLIAWTGLVFKSGFDLVTA